MNNDSAPSEDRRIVSDYDRILEGLVRQLRDLDARVRTLETASRSGSPVSVDTERAGAAGPRAGFPPRTDRSGLAEEIASIGSSLDSMIASIDAGRSADETGGADRETELVDLSSAPRRPAWRSASTRPAGWQPVSTRRAG